MTKEQIQGKWDQFKGEIHKKWAKLTDDDMENIHGDIDILKGKLKEKYGYEKEQLEKELDEFNPTLH